MMQAPWLVNGGHGASFRHLLGILGGLLLLDAAKHLPVQQTIGPEIDYLSAAARRGLLWLWRLLLWLLRSKRSLGAAHRIEAVTEIELEWTGTLGNLSHCLDSVCATMKPVSS
jgi:hypothetical protein